MSNFVVGLIIAPVMLVGYWLLNATLLTPSAPEQGASRSLSLLDINYVPSKPRKAVTESEYTAAGGALTSLKKNIGKPVILHFWAPWCGVCLMEMPDLDAFVANHGDEVEIICLSNDPSGGRASQDYLNKHNLTHIALNIDKNGEQQGVLGRALAIHAFPTTIFISAKGEEIGRIMGPVDWQGKAGELLLAHMKTAKL